MMYAGLSFCLWFGVGGQSRSDFLASIVTLTSVYGSSENIGILFWGANNRSPIV